MDQDRIGHDEVKIAVFKRQIEGCAFHEGHLRILLLRPLQSIGLRIQTPEFQARIDALKHAQLSGYVAPDLQDPAARKPFRGEEPAERFCLPDFEQPLPEGVHLFRRLRAAIGERPSKLRGPNLQLLRPWLHTALHQRRRMAITIIVPTNGWKAPQSTYLTPLKGDSNRPKPNVYA